MLWNAHPPRERFSRLSSRQGAILGRQLSLGQDGKTLFHGCTRTLNTGEQRFGALGSAGRHPEGFGSLGGVSRGFSRGFAAPVWIVSAGLRTQGRQWLGGHRGFSLASPRASVGDAQNASSKR